MKSCSSDCLSQSCQFPHLHHLRNTQYYCDGFVMWGFWMHSYICVPTHSSQMHTVIFSKSVGSLRKALRLKGDWWQNLHLLKGSHCSLKAGGTQTTQLADSSTLGKQKTCLSGVQYGHSLALGKSYRIAEVTVFWLLKSFWLRLVCFSVM